MYKCVARRSPVEPHVPLWPTARFCMKPSCLAMPDVSRFVSPVPPLGLLVMHKMRVIHDEYGVVIYTY